MRRSQLIALTFALSFPAQSIAGPSISTDSAPGVNFSAYKTYEWVNAPMPAGMNPIMYERIQTGVESGLAQKGYRKASPGDLSLVLSVGAREKTDVQTWGGMGWGWRRWGGPQVDVWQYTQGQLTLDVFDTKTKQAVWHGQATDTINPNKPKPGKVDAAVMKIMAQFPATAAQ